MQIYPAIDIKDGKCVRLFKGDFKKKTIYNISPTKQALYFQKIGFKRLHLIDLDGAKDGNSSNVRIIKNIINKTNLKIQLGGGIRTEKQINFWLSLGVETLILGTLAIENIRFLEYLCHKFPKKISLAIDIKNNFLYSRGWLRKSKFKTMSFIQKIKNLPINRIIYTDINRDGTKLGINFKKVTNFISKIRFPVIISGGISSFQDIVKAEKLKKIHGVIIGKSLYDNSIKYDDLIKIIKK